MLCLCDAWCECCKPVLCCAVLWGLECEIDIQKTVEEARLSRSGMVQTEEQYKFIYDVIKHYIETQKARIVAQVTQSTVVVLFCFVLFCLMVQCVLDMGWTNDQGHWLTDDMKLAVQKNVKSNERRLNTDREAANLLNIISLSR